MAPGLLYQKLVWRKNCPTSCCDVRRQQTVSDSGRLAGLLPGSSPGQCRNSGAGESLMTEPTMMLTNVAHLGRLSSCNRDRQVPAMVGGYEDADQWLALATGPVVSRVLT